MRILVGFVFVISGTEKLLSPYQNFLYAIQGYDLIGPPWDDLVARFFPWAELIAGVFVILGLWTLWALRCLLFFVTIFLIIVGQAIIRNLPLNECGCFGSLFSFPLPTVILMDSVLWMYIALLIIRIERSSIFSLDEFFIKSKD